MPRDSAPDEGITDQSENNSLEQRVTALEEQNKELKSALEHQQGSGLPNVTRRQALGGLLGGGTLLGAAGSASAQFGDEFPFGEDGPPGRPFADEDHSGDYLGEGEPVANIDISNVNRVHWLDPDADDWGAAVNNTLEEMETGDVLKVPPVEYNTKTKAFIDKDITIMGAGLGGGYPSPRPVPEPIITKQADIPILEAQEGQGSSLAEWQAAIQIHLRGLRFNSAVDDTTPGAIVHGTVDVKNVIGANLGSHVLLIQQTSYPVDNANNCLVQNISGRFCNGSVVRIENLSGGAPNVNAQHVYVRNAFRNQGWAIDADAGFGNYFHVQVIQGQGGEPKGTIRLNTTRSLAETTYVGDGTPVAIRFDDIGNTGRVLHVGGVAEAFAGNTDQNKTVRVLPESGYN